jgi:hypothetical protein
VPEYSAEFSAPPEFSGGVPEKYLSTYSVHGLFLLLAVASRFRCFCCCWSSCYWLTCSCFVHAGCWHPCICRCFLFVVRPTVIGVLILPYSYCSCCFFSRAHARNVFRALEEDILHSPMPENSGPWSQARSPSQGPNFYGMEECKMSHSRDRKTFLALGNANSLLPGT